MALGKTLFGAGCLTHLVDEAYKAGVGKLAVPAVSEPQYRKTCVSHVRRVETQLLMTHAQKPILWLAESFVWGEGGSRKRSRELGRLLPHNSAGAHLHHLGSLPEICLFDLLRPVQIGSAGLQHLQLEAIQVAS